VVLSDPFTQAQIGKARGYEMELDRKAFLKDLGQAVALRRGASKLAQEAIKHYKGGNGAPK